MQGFQDDSRAVRTLYRVADDVPTEAQLKAAQEQDKKEKKERLLSRAAKGDKYAAYPLGGNYLFGTDGFIKDIPEAMKWIRKAAEADNAEAQLFLGTLLFNGHGGAITVDRNEAIRWIRKSAANGYTDARDWLDRYEKQSIRTLRQ